MSAPTIPSAPRDVLDTLKGDSRAEQFKRFVLSNRLQEIALAKNYLDEDLFRKNNIKLCYKTYDYLPYPQLWGAFEGNVSVLDLIANTGPEAKKFLKSQSPDMVAVE